MAMMLPFRTRAGHSLPELIVALTLLGATLAAASATALLGARWTHEAVLRQRALGVAEATLDSLSVLDWQPAAGERDLPDLAARVEWSVEGLVAGGGATVRVTVQAVGGTQGGGSPIAELRGLWIPPLPELEP
jgi:hypothetical protein